jgi:hypothetical protein
MKHARTVWLAAQGLLALAVCTPGCTRTPATAQAGAGAPAAERAPCCGHEGAPVPAAAPTAHPSTEVDPLAGPSIGAGAGTGFVKVVNAFCPIMQRKAIEGEVPTDLTRALDGETIGVCCDECAAAWDALTDAERRERVQAVRPAGQPEMAPR